MAFDPVLLFVRQLEARYSHVALFFYDAIGGRTIGIKWRAQQPRAGVNVAAAHAQNAAQERGQAQGTEFAASAVLADMACLGAGLVAGFQSFNH